MIADAMRERREIFIFAGGPGSGCHGPSCGRPRGIKQSFQTSSGATYTILKPSRRNIAKGSHAWTARKDQFKGKFKTTAENVKGFNMKTLKTDAKMRGSVYDAKYGHGDKYEGHGKTIFVYKDARNMRAVVVEVPHDEMNHSATARSFKFKNFGAAAGFLSKRYGIKQKLPKMEAAAENIPHDANIWTSLAKLGPEQIENLFEHVYTEYGQAFRPVSIDETKQIVWVSLKDGRKVSVSL